MSKIAILDLGTNTFHLLIIQKKGPQGFEELLRKRIHVKLALDGIDNLSEAAMDRGIEALLHFKEIIQKYQVAEVKVIGTAALRTAQNASDYIRQIKTATGFEVRLIDGREEALLIYQGVSQVWNDPITPVMIMDIGGGSVEFIIADTQTCYWFESFPVGVAILHRQFHQSEPISLPEQEALDQFLSGHFLDLEKAIAAFQPQILIGASGTFDVVGSMIDGRADIRYREVAVDTVYQLINEVVPMDVKQRLQDDRIPDNRVDMIVVAFLLLKKVLAAGPFTKVGISTYALKEGVALTII